MNRHYHHTLISAAAAVAVAIGSAALAGDDKDKTHVGTASDPARVQPADRVAGSAINNAASPNLPAGVAPKEADDVEDIREVIADATEAALNKGGLDALVRCFVDQDRNRLGASDRTDKADPTLDGRIEQIRQAYKAKYGDDFSVENDDEDKGALTSVAVIQGEIQDPALVMSNWPVRSSAAGVGTTVDRTGGAVADVGDRPVAPPDVGRPNNDPNALAGGDVNLDRGREVAIAHLPGLSGASPVTVSIIGEIQAWKIDVPNTVDAGKLHQNLLNHLTYVGDNQAQWPADKLGFQRYLAHHVMMAVYDMPVERGGGTDPSMNKPADR